MVEPSPKQAGDLGWFGWVGRRTCLGSKSQRSICWAVFISSVEVKCHSVLDYEPWHKGAWASRDSSWHIHVAQLRAVQLHQHGSQSSVVALAWHSTKLVRETREAGVFSEMEAQHYAAGAGLALLPAGAQVLLAWASLHSLKTSSHKPAPHRAKYLTNTAQKDTLPQGVYYLNKMELV